jgi:hypothetical protein
MEHGVTPISVPFSADGTWEGDIFDLAANDWCFLMTASEIPTRKVIENARALVDFQGENLDLVMIPKLLWSLGICSPESPWHASYQPFLVHRKRVQMSSRIHENFSAQRERTGLVPIGDGCYVAHMTHTGGEAFLRKHLEYAIHEVDSDESLDSIFKRCCSSITSAFKGVGPGHELWAQKCGWNIYFYSIMLLASERGKDHLATYREIAGQLIESDWEQTETNEP